MRKIIPFLIVSLFIISGLNVVATDENQANDSEIQIVPISNPNEELQVYTVSYSQHSKDSQDIKQPQNYIKKVNNKQTYDYVIITTESLNDAITASTFIEWKTLLGYKIKIVKITDDEITSQPGQDLPEKIRNFLRSYYQEWGINFVLIVGNHATIPMRYCYPDPTNHRFDIFDWTSGECPTDYYYADLTDADEDSWDLDGDGYYGEYGDDLPDFNPEVYVGRIPTNDESRITYTLNKLVTFEQDTGDWKEHALHAGAFFYFTNEDHSGNPAMDGAKLSYYIEQDIMTGWTISHYSEQEGLEKSVYSWPALTLSAFINDWRNGQYSIINWQGHGWTNRVARKVWTGDDGDGVPEAHEISWPDFININSNLDDDYPSVVTAESCYVGCPEPAAGGNLGIDLLTDPTMGASIGVVASSRSPYGSFDWPNNPGGSDSIIYEFNRFMINDSKKVGEALYESKYYCNFHWGWEHYAEYIDMFAFNLFGDPSLILQGTEVENNPPSPPTIDGPIRGNAGTSYTYKFNSVDPEDDDVSYYILWGDGYKEIWKGPFASGEDFEIDHTYANKGTFTIEAKAKDSNGVESGWSTFTVTMPRNKVMINPLFLRILEMFANGFLFLQNIFGL